ncbi:hypothetical protein [Breoghania sp. L-A4]|uniref:hypothetical protein n=1 Tax=Breoghania sp. L-A4 TaxID=2304600 RepID=UPI003204A01E
MAPARHGRGAAVRRGHGNSRPKEELIRLFEHLEGALDVHEYFRPSHRRPTMVRALRGILQKASLTEQEVRTMRGVVAALEGRRTRPRKRTAQNAQAASADGGVGVDGDETGST